MRFWVKKIHVVPSNRNGARCGTNFDKNELALQVEIRSGI